MSNVALSEPPEDAAEILADSKAREVIGRLTLEFVDSSRDTLSSLEVLLGNIAVGAVPK